MRKTAVAGKRADAEIHRAILRAIGVTLFDKSGDHRDHPLDVHRLRRLGKMIRALDAKRVEILEERLFERRGEFGQRPARRATAADRLVIDIGEIHHPIHTQAAVFQVTLQQVLENIGAEIPDVGEIVNRGSAGVEPHHTGLAGRKILHPPGERIEKSDRHQLGSKGIAPVKINPGETRRKFQTRLRPV